MSVKPKIIAIVGPTASGKTALSIALAKKYNGEIINMDSRQVYKDFDIGTDKHIEPGIKHHLFDIVEGDVQWTLGEHLLATEIAVQNILAIGHLPILVGGTGLYVQSFVEGWNVPKMECDNNLRVELENKTLEQLVQMLKEKDPRAFAMIDLKNKRRVVRALEVGILTGDSFLDHRTKQEPRYSSLILMPEINRHALYERIDERVEEHFKSGLVEEVGTIVKKYGPNCPGMESISYHEFKPYFEGTATLEDIKQRIKYDNHAYVRRQVTWFNKMPNILIYKNIADAEKKVELFI